MEVPLPPLEPQHCFAKRLADIGGIIAEQDTVLTKANELERALMAQLLK